MLNGFITPPENQGQIVEVSYACAEVQVIRRWYDQSDGETQYSVSRTMSGDEGDYWNGAPRNRRWRSISKADAERMIAAHA